MRSSRPALFLTALALCGAGCFSDRGIAIEVDVGDTDATLVELYVGNRACVDHDRPEINCRGGIAPPLVAEHLAGTVWFRDDLVPYVAAVSGGKATFRLEADEETTLRIVIAVGSAGPGTRAVGTATLLDVVVPVDTARVIPVTLVEANELEPSTSGVAGDRARVWTQPDDPGSSCLVVEHWADGQVERDFIVPADDPDCDRVVRDLECDRAAHLATTEPPACYVASNDSTTEPCKLGAFACRDGSGLDERCLATSNEVCVPKEFCRCEGGATPEGCAKMKLQPPIVPAVSVPHIECTVQLGVDKLACKNDSRRIDLNRRLGNAGCKDPTLSTLDPKSVAPAGRSHNFGGVDLELTSPDQACGFVVQVNSGGRDPGVDFGMVRLVAGERAVLLPIIFRFEGPVPCIDNVPMVCVFHDEVTDDPMWRCGL